MIVIAREEVPWRAWLLQLLWVWCSTKRACRDCSPLAALESSGGAAATFV